MRSKAFCKLRGGYWAKHTGSCALSAEGKKHTPKLFLLFYLISFCCFSFLSAIKWNHVQGSRDGQELWLLTADARSSNPGLCRSLTEQLGEGSSVSCWEKESGKEGAFCEYSAFRNLRGKVRVETWMKYTRMTSAVIKWGIYLAEKREVASWSHLRRGTDRGWAHVGWFSKRVGGKWGLVLDWILLRSRDNELCTWNYTV